MSLPRRRFLLSSLGAALGAAWAGWLDRLAWCADTAAPRSKRCILLWMDGGPSHTDTFDPKPDAGREYRGPFESIATSVAGVRVGEKFPRLAALMSKLAILRGMSTAEADHGRARIHMHTGYRPGEGLTYPGLGSIVSSELGRPGFELPSFVATGRPLNKYDFLSDPGYLGPEHAPLAHYDASRPLDNLDPRPSREAFRRREAALAEIETEFSARYPSAAATGHRAVFERAVRLMRADAAHAFDIDREPAASRERYGDHDFGRGCLLARRLVEVGVPFVEVYLANWDTHEKRTADEAAALMPVVDRGMATLIEDLHDRGILDNTLVIWMGEFGRTPRVNQNGGRDHYAKAWSTVVAGGGIAGGQTIGRTSGTAAEVVERPISAADFMASVCGILGIDYRREIETPIGRPVAIVDKSARPIEELSPRL